MKRVNHNSNILAEMTSKIASVVSESKEALWSSVLYRVAKLCLVQTKYTRIAVANPKDRTVPPMGLLCHEQPCRIELHYDIIHRM